MVELSIAHGHGLELLMRAATSGVSACTQAAVCTEKHQCPLCASFRLTISGWLAGLLVLSCVLYITLFSHRMAGCDLECCLCCVLLIMLHILWDMASFACQFAQGQAEAEVATAPTPGLPPSDKIPPVSS